MGAHERESIFSLTPSKKILNLSWLVSKFFVSLSLSPFPSHVSLNIFSLTQLSGKNNGLKCYSYLSTIMT